MSLVGLETKRGMESPACFELAACVRASCMLSSAKSWQGKKKLAKICNLSVTSVLMLDFGKTGDGRTFAMPISVGKMGDGRTFARPTFCGC